MREIKFRGKILQGKNKGKWAEGYYTVDFNGVHWIQHDYDVYPVDPETVGQGFNMPFEKDQTIYDGDIIESSQERLEVYWAYTEFRVKSIKTRGYGKTGYSPWKKNKNRNRSVGIFSEGKVIGNIHDNPELLEGK